MRARRGTKIAAIGACVAILTACAGQGSATQLQRGPVSAAAEAVALPVPEHIVVVVMENRDPDEVVDTQEAPYFNSLVAEGSLFTNSFAVTRPSQPNYLALFSGATHGVTDNSCPHDLTGPNLASALAAAGLTFGGYSEDLPQAGFTGCRSGLYVRKHSPWANWTDLPASVNQPFSAFAADYAALPTVAFVTPNLCNDTHECPVSTGDAWMRTHLAPYVEFARTHNSLLIITWDEANKKAEENRVATLFVGPMVVPGRYTGFVDHYRVLRTIGDMYRLPPLGRSAAESPITEVWTLPPATTPR